MTTFTTPNTITIETDHLVIAMTRAEVEVSDDRDRVDGYYIKIHDNTNKFLGDGTAIPPEGSSIDCWLSIDYDSAATQQQQEEISQVIYDNIH